MARALLVVFALLGTLRDARGQSDGWQREWARTVEAARKEGQVNIYIGGWEAVIESGAFQKTYPEIKVVSVGGRGGETAKRILAERRAGKYLADVSSRRRGVELPDVACREKFRSDQTCSAPS